MKVITITLFFLFILSYSVFALEVVKFKRIQPIKLTFIRANIGTFGTWTLTNTKGVEMELVCAKNKYFDNSSHAFLEYKNFYRQVAGKFQITPNSVCKELYQYFKKVYGVISQENPFTFELDPQKKTVYKITYPKIDEFANDGFLEDLLPRKVVHPNFKLKRKKDFSKVEALKEH